MSEDNTPGVGAVLSAVQLKSIPEAHSYLMVGGSRFDFTGLPGGSSSPFDSLISETVVFPANLLEVKKHLHAKHLKIWAEQRELSVDDAWSIREACFAALANGPSSPR